MEVYLGIDVGSVTVKFAVLNAADELIASLYLPAAGRPVAVIQQGLGQIGKQLPPDVAIKGVATTGSARYLAGAIVGADLVKNEITCQAVAAVHYSPEVRTVIEIGGQDSKLILIRDGLVADFAMNTVCAAGTGSFLDHQAGRLRISIEEFSRRALAGKDTVHISGRCTVFAESDIVHKQQMGHNVDDIIYGLCRTLVRNYLSDVASGKDIKSPIVFQGGVAFNQGIIRALKEELKTEIIVPPHHEVMGAIGAALLAHEESTQTLDACRFRGFGISDVEYSTSSFECRSCPSSCEIVRIEQQGDVIASWGGQCDIWETAASGKREKN
ncbi:MAG: acyl-CoA dehydratase activase [Dehalococcoidales bacterium]